MRRNSLWCATSSAANSCLKIVRAPQRSKPRGSPLREKVEGDLRQKPGGSSVSIDLYGKARDVAGLQRHDFGPEMLEARVQAICVHTDWPVSLCSLNFCFRRVQLQTNLAQRCHQLLQRSYGVMMTRCTYEELVRKRSVQKTSYAIITP